MPVPEYQPLTESPDGDDELLWPEPDSRYGWLRRVALVAALALVAAGAGYAVYRNGRHPEHSVAAPTHRSGVPKSGTPLSQQFPGSATDAITASGHSVYVLSSGAVYRDQLGANAALGSSAVASGFGLDLTQPGVSYQLVLDTRADRLWIVGLGAVNLPVFALNARTLAVLGHVRTPGIVQGAAALDGQLYLAEGDGLLDVARTLAVRPLLGVTNSVFSLAADPTRHRLIIFEAAVGLVTYQPDLGAWSQAQPTPVPKGWLNVTAGTVWMAGYGSNGAMIARLDPSTLRPLLTRRVLQVGSPGAQFVGTGADVLWVGSAEGASGVLCLSARTGRVLQSLSDVNQVASQRGRAYTDDGSSTPEPLRLAGCPG